MNIDKAYKQMKLSHFCESYDIPKSTALLWVHSANFPAYNLCSRWYVDIEKYEIWREQTHEKSYKYA